MVVQIPGSWVESGSIFSMFESCWSPLPSFLPRRRSQVHKKKLWHLSSPTWGGCCQATVHARVCILGLVAKQYWVRNESNIKLNAAERFCWNSPSQDSFSQVDYLNKLINKWIWTKKKIKNKDFGLPYLQGKHNSYSHVWVNNQLATVSRLVGFCLTRPRNPWLNRSKPINMLLC